MWLQASNAGHLPWHQVPFPAILLYPGPILLVTWKMPVYPVSTRGLLSCFSLRSARITNAYWVFCLFVFKMIFMYWTHVLSAWKTSTLLTDPSPQPYFPISFHLKFRRKQCCSFSFNYFIFYLLKKMCIVPSQTSVLDSINKWKWIKYVCALKELFEAKCDHNRENSILGLEIIPSERVKSSIPEDSMFNWVWKKASVLTEGKCGRSLAQTSRKLSIA